MDDNFDYIDRYFSGEMTADEKDIFEKKCSTDIVFAKEVAGYIAMDDFLKNKWIARKKQELVELKEKDFSNIHKTAAISNNQGPTLPVYQDQLFRRTAFFKRKLLALAFASLIFLLTTLFFLVSWLSVKSQKKTLQHQSASLGRQYDFARHQLEIIVRDMKIVPYKPQQAEIEKLAGVWMAYTGSPQVRKSNPNRYHMTVPNIIDVRFVDNCGYFIFNRYGPDFNQIGYMQFETPNLVSMHSYLIDTLHKISVPKLSLLQLEGGKDTFNVMSASWSFDNKKNAIIGIREVFIKMGKGSAQEVTNSIESMDFTGKIIHWQKSINKVDTIKLKNEFLDTLPASIRSLLDETSIILKDPDSAAFIQKPRKEKKHR